MNSLNRPFVKLIPIFIFFAFLSVSGQYKRAINSQKQQLFICMDDLSPQTMTYIKSQGIQYVPIIYQNFIDPRKENMVDTAILGGRIRQIFPDATTKGLGILDWEPAGFDKMSIKDPNYSKLLDEFGKAVTYAKKVRPNIKWGFYGLPYREYWHFTDNWKDKCMSLLPLLKKCDILAPSLYDFFPDSVQSANNAKYVTNNVGMALTIGTMIKKPVYPFVWHRWHDSSKEYGLIPIPREELQNYVNKILATSVNGQKVAGIIWWGAEKFYYNHKAPVMLKEAKSYSNFNEFQDSTIKNYSNTFLQLFNKRTN